MKKEDLMIGDWVMFKYTQHQFKVYSINHDKISNTKDAVPFEINDAVIPIPLTREILEKNGFEYYNVGHHYGWCIMDEDYRPALPFSLSKWFAKNDDEFIWGPEVDDNESTYVHEMGRIKYVHELQHLLKDCKIEKEIVL